MNCLDCDDAVKKWPLYVINGGVQAAEEQLRRQQLVTTPAINAIACELTAACAAFTATVLLPSVPSAYVLQKSCLLRN